MPVILTASAETEIQFHHLDPMNIVWHGNHANFFEMARVALLDRIDYGYAEMEKSGYLWPVTELKVRYAHPLVYRQKITIHADLVEWENRLRINFRIHSKETGKRLCTGHTIQVAVDRDTKELMWETPAVFRKKLEPFLA